MIPLYPPGSYVISYKELVALGGGPMVPKRPFIKKLRGDDPLKYHGDFSTVIMFMVYPWVLYDERDGKPLYAFKTQEAAFLRAMKLVTVTPGLSNTERLRHVSVSDVEEFIKQYRI